MVMGIDSGIGMDCGERTAAGAQFRPGRWSASPAKLLSDWWRGALHRLGPTSLGRTQRTWLQALCGIASWLSIIGTPMPVMAANTLCELALQAEAGGVHRFSVELAQTPEEQARGLMHRESLEVGHGMLFVMPIARRTAMWMKDTLIPLDMVFFDGAGVMVHLEQRAEPQSLRYLGPDEPVRYVLEVNAGEAAGLRRGGTWRLDVAALAACLLAQGDESGGAPRP
jgi:uncharacterized membrane protein (UPF0127 family)